jgi:tetratricopeptide (TPR) repeat protein
MLEVLNKLPEALIEINKVIARNPRDGEAYRARAQLKVKNKDLAGAIRDYDTTIELEPTAKTLRDRANLHLQMGHKDLYKRDLEAAKKIMDSQF